VKGWGLRYVVSHWLELCRGARLTAFILRTYMHKCAHCNQEFMNCCWYITENYTKYQLLLNNAMHIFAVYQRILPLKQVRRVLMEILGGWAQGGRRGKRGTLQWMEIEEGKVLHYW